MGANIVHIGFNTIWHEFLMTSGFFFKAYVPNLCPLLPNQKFESFDENSAEKKSIQKDMVVNVSPNPWLSHKVKF